jgi:hypothetical protein
MGLDLTNSFSEPVAFLESNFSGFVECLPTQLGGDFEVKPITELFNLYTELKLRAPNAHTDVVLVY